MSLQICPECKKVNPYWNIYKAINFRGFKKGMSMECTFCKENMIVDYDLKDKRKLYIAGISWMALPILNIILAYFEVISYFFAILIVIAFHFSAMYYIIKGMNYLLEKKN
ncbi:MAG: hypothetical protein PHZ26_05880 [Candidatus Gracilibacteria bacterium]|nr:hypothetical protein [Candidatus Gracilibacteria bacterium]MDD2909242.1 hypothetical protein [Candidatus Gracilibacteria bacterium]